MGHCKAPLSRLGVPLRTSQGLTNLTNFSEIHHMKYLPTIALFALFAGLTSCNQDTSCTCEIAGETTTSTCEGCTGDELADFEAACTASDAVAQLVGGSCAID